MVKPATGLDPLLRRPFSIFEIVRDPQGAIAGLSLLNKHVGLATMMLYDAQPGDRWQVLGPLGQPFVPVDPPAAAWMVAGGVGLAPFATLAEALALRGTPMTLFYGGRSTRDLYYDRFFERLGAHLVLTTEDGTRGERGRVTVPLDRALAAASADRALTIYACGPTPMMRAVASLGARAGRPVFVSLEPVMGCGMGGCYSCVVRVRRGTGSHFVRSCLEGPVFNASAVVWEALGAGH
jgi:dihydroorotate dehydrogenase electron transfer subunit